MIMINMFTIGDRIQQRRLNLKITQQKLAKDLKISYHYLSKIENGQANIALDLLVRICQYLELDLAYALAGSIYRNEIYGTNIPATLLSSFNRSSPKKQEIIYQILSTLEEI